MSKICCIGDADICPKSSSCSMVLRSSCTHKHSHSRESSISKEQLRASSHQKRKNISSVSKKDSSNGTFHLESFESSLKSPEESYSVLTGPFLNSFELSHSAHQKIVETSSVNVSCAKELYFYQSLNGNHINHKECSSDYSSASESDMMNSAQSSYSMSDSQRYNTRSTRSSVRSLSASDDDDINILSIVRRGIVSNNYTNASSSISSRLSERTNGQSLSSHHTPFRERPHDVNRHIMTPRYTDSLIDRFRWFLWRWIYLQLIRIINFDVWLLSRIHNYRKNLVIFLLLLPLLLFLLWSLNPFQDKSVMSSFELLPSTFSSVVAYFMQKEENILIPTTDPNSCTSDSCGSFGVIPNWPVKPVESASVEIEEEHAKSLDPQKEDIKSIQPNMEEMKLFAAEILKEEISSLRLSIQEVQTKKPTMEEMKLFAAEILKDDISSLRLSIQEVQTKNKYLTETVEKLEDDLKRKNEKLASMIREVKGEASLNSEYESKIAQINHKFKAFEDKLGVLDRLQNSCDKQLSEKDIVALLNTHLDNHELNVFKRIVDGDSDQNSRLHFFSAWLNSKFFTQEKLMQVIDAVRKKETACQEKEMSHENVIKVVESTVLKYVDSIKKNLSQLTQSSYSSFSADLFSEDKVKRIVKEAIMLYDADKIGQVDYALESGGGSVLSTRCSETFVEKYGKWSLFGLPLWSNSNSPRTAIQPEIQPGRCWAFKGSQGFLVIELSATIYPTGFTMEHIPVSLSRTGSIDSAPKNFSVWGLDSEKDSMGTILGEFLYDINGEPLQYFAVQKPSEKPYSYIELQIHSNHGNIEYTCLYRFRVHGKRFR